MLSSRATSWKKPCLYNDCRFFTKSVRGLSVQLANFTFLWEKNKPWWIVVCNPNPVRTEISISFLFSIKQVSGNVVLINTRAGEMTPMAGIFKTCYGGNLVTKHTSCSLTRPCWVLLGDTFLLWYKTRKTARSLLLVCLFQNVELLLFSDATTAVIVSLREQGSGTQACYKVPFHCRNAY